MTITFCPLFNTAIAFERIVDGQILDFGTTGRLHFSNLIMYDRQTETWWQQATGEAIAGDLTGTQLTFRLDGSEIVDYGTGSTWNILGQAVSGPLAGEQLNPVVAVNHFWFTWAAFKPETEVYKP